MMIPHTNAQISALQNEDVANAFQCINELQLISKIGNDLNSKDKWGDTPLHIAANLGRYEMVDALIKLGAK